MAAAALSARSAPAQGSPSAQDSLRTRDSLGDSTGASQGNPLASLDSMVVFVTRTGAKYHLIGCSSLKSSAIPMLLVDARKRYDPCGRCHPPR